MKKTDWMYYLLLMISAAILFGHGVAAGADGNNGCTAVDNTPGHTGLQTVARFDDRLVTGVTVSEAGRIFVNFPYWYPEWYQGAVAEVNPDGSVTAYPDDQWNAWRLENRLDPVNHFVCVQSVVADKRGSLWVLDPGAPWPSGHIEDAPKLVRIDLETNQVAKIFKFPSEITPEGSYLNDVRIDLDHGYAYMTDSGKGALVVLDLKTAQARRVLEGHPSTTAQPVTLLIGGRPLAGGNGKTPKINSDGIAYDPGADMLYYHCLTGYHTWRVPADVLRTGTPEQVASAVKDLGSDVVTDGMHLDAEGRLYYTALEYDGILRRDTEGNIAPLIIDSRLKWPDTLAIGPDGDLYVTISQIHNTPRFSDQPGVPGPWALYRIKAGIGWPGKE